jgi:hypothetical protein
MSAQSMDDDIIEVKLSKGSLAALAKAMGGGGKGGKGKGSIGGLAGIAGKGMLLLGGIGVAIGAILGAVKAISGSSPMLKQMFKLMNFGIMMIFRPIGDFIGFMLRPILVMLLRNFIIPWYKDAMPIMQSMGAIFGSSMATDLINFFKHPEQVIADGLQSLLTGTAETVTSMLNGTFDWATFSTDLLATLKTVFVDWNPLVQIGAVLGRAFAQVDWDSVDGVFSGVGAAFNTAVQKAWDDAWNGLAWEISFFFNDIEKAWDDYWDGVAWNFYFMWTGIEKWFTDGLGTVVAKWYKFWTWVGDWVYRGIDGISASWNSMWKWVKDWIYNGIQSISSSWNDIWGWLKDWIWNGLNAAGHSLGSIFGYADGGQINEPIIGMGKSGQMYSFGEEGSETVIPHGESSGGGGITLNISVGNISSEGDMRNFETRVMEVLENANSRRGRV